MKVLPIKTLKKLKTVKLELWSQKAWRWLILGHKNNKEINENLNGWPKFCFNAETNNFDQQMACGAPVRWSKYTTDSW